jgi:uncharacterized cofD-like protein
MKNIVIIGGGTGTFTLLSGLRKYPSNNSVIVSSADDGGSTGILRKDLGVMPPGDIRQCLVGLSYTQKEMQELFNFRFDRGSLAGHSVGNIILAALEKIAGTEEGINLASKMLNVRGQVLPVTLRPTTLSAVLQNGKKLHGEHNIDEPFFASNSVRQRRTSSDKKATKAKPSGIKQLFLSPAKVNPKALKAIEQADVIVFGPGDLFTSILPNILVKGVALAINKSKAKKVLVTNIMTKFGQTDGFKASDFVKTLESYLKGKIDYVLTNNKKPDREILQKYAKEKARFVETDMTALSKTKVTAIAHGLLSYNIIKKTAGDKLKRSFLRHDSEKLAKIIWGIT